MKENTCERCEQARRREKIILAGVVLYLILSAAISVFSAPVGTITNSYIHWAYTTPTPTGVISNPTVSVMYIDHGPLNSSGQKSGIVIRLTNKPVLPIPLANVSELTSNALTSIPVGTYWFEAKALFTSGHLVTYGVGTGVWSDTPAIACPTIIRPK
jgi:hypothetical protein